MDGWTDEWTHPIMLISTYVHILLILIYQTVSLQKVKNISFPFGLEYLELAMGHWLTYRQTSQRKGGDGVSLHSCSVISIKKQTLGMLSVILHGILTSLKK